MIDRAIGIAGLALAIISAVLPWALPKMNKWVAHTGLAVGVALLLIAGVLFLIPASPAHDGSSIGGVKSQGNGNINVGGTGNRVEVPALRTERALGLVGRCQPVALPVSIPAHRELHFIPYNVRWLLDRGSGLGSLDNFSDDAVQLPNSKQVAAMKSDLRLSATLFATRCAVENHGDTNVIQARIPFNMSYSNEAAGITNQHIYFSAIVGPIDIGQTFVFYVLGDCPGTFAAVWENNIKVRLPGDAAERTAHLYTPEYDPAPMVEQITMSFQLPKQENWLGDGPCD
ncbi:MAG: hypothetical protein JO208_14395 [Alphaproteobacteria bacterium]|nr:hypothetical protein [Alphaproteobacteria bacterium]